MLSILLLEHFPVLLLVLPKLGRIAVQRAVVVGLPCEKNIKCTVSSTVRSGVGLGLWMRFECLQRGDMGKLALEMD